MTERWRRPAAVAAIVLLALVVLTSLVGFVDDLRRFLIDIPLLLIALVAAWHAITRTGVRRLIAIVVCVAALGGVVAVALDEGGPTAIGLLARVAMLLAGVGLARFALARDIRSLRASATPRLLRAARGARDARPTRTAGPARRVAPQPQVGRGEGRAVPPRRRVPSPAHRADRAPSRRRHAPARS
jgi:hypothetical protein